MGANATGVAARIDTETDFPAELLHRARRILNRLTHPRLLVVIGAAIASALVAGAIWLDEGSRQEETVSRLSERLDLVVALAAREGASLSAGEQPAADHLAAIARALPEASLRDGLRLFLADSDGLLLAAEPRLPRLPRTLSDLFGDAPPRDAGSQSGTIRARSAAPAAERPGPLTAVRPLPGGFIAAVQPRPAPVGGGRVWRRTEFLLLAVLAGLGLLSWGYARSLARATRFRRDRIRLRRLVETALARGRCGVWDWDIAGKRIFWSRSMYELLGYDRRDEFLTVDELNGILDPENGSLFDLAARAATEPGAVLDHDFRVRNANGAWVWLRARAELVTDPEDGGRHLVGIAVDVSEERQRAAREAMADIRLRDGLEAVPEAFVLWDAEGRLVLCNSRFRDLHRLAPEAVRPGQRFDDVALAAGLSGPDAALLAAHAPAGTPATVDAQLQDGRWLHVSARRTGDGGFVSVGTDITALKFNEHRLLASERRLRAALREQKLLKRAADLHVHELADLAERYHEERNRAESASRAKTEFLAKMSHELRTPLNAVIGFTDVMRHELFGPLGHRKYAEYIADIGASGENLLALIDAMLQMSELDAGRYQLVRGPVDLAAVVGRAVRTVSAEAEAKGLSLAIDTREPGRIIADGDAVQQILTHLLRNAVTFTDRGGTVAVRVRPAGDALNLFVEDDGRGIPPDLLARLGSPFEQCDLEDHRRDKGCGLGLPLAKGLAEMHRGSLRIRSQEGVGTIVLVHLPLGAPANDEPAAPPALDAAE